MKKALIVSSLLLAGALTGCSSQNISPGQFPLNGLVETNIKADVKVGEKITGRSSATRIFIFTISPDTTYADGSTYGADGFGLGIGPVEKVKAAAAYNAIAASGADVIVAPRYTVKQNDYLLFATVDVTVEGYKGTIRSVK